MKNLYRFTPHTTPHATHHRRAAVAGLRQAAGRLARVAIFLGFPADEAGLSDLARWQTTAVRFHTRIALRAFHEHARLHVAARASDGQHSSRIRVLAISRTRKHFTKAEQGVARKITWL